ncbi:UNVERIFIED_CONTAM: putative glutamate carboxypeptidase AMP1 [Sesamum latifolium]|uniref:Aminopeptidase NAALADL1 n=1 Tax=Sesamum latifolium TaxID=2727402 RepID=A0AAW2VES0_9LAMI
MTTIHNVFAVIKGSEEPDRSVLLGNHRDAWTFGAVDPNSGTAALLDIARRLALLMRLGWNPRRTIILCSWDAEEFGMIGSTEWVEQNLVNLGSKAVAYLNVDCAAQGPGFFVSATPQLDDLLVEVTKQVKDPESENLYLYERWAAANKGVNEYKNVLTTLLEGTVSLDPIAAAIQEFIAAANETEEEAKKLRVDQNIDESTVLRRRMLNDRLMLTERGFLDSEGLRGRQWFKHLVYGPRGITESKIAFFPGIGEAMSGRMNEEEREATIRHEMWRVARAIQRGAIALRGELR